MLERIGWSGQADVREGAAEKYSAATIGRKLRAEPPPPCPAPARPGHAVGTPRRRGQELTPTTTAQTRRRNREQAPVGALPLGQSAAGHRLDRRMCDRVASTAARPRTTRNRIGRHPWAGTCRRMGLSRRRLVRLPSTVSTQACAGDMRRPSTPSDSGSSGARSGVGVSIDANELDGLEGEAQAWNAMDLDAVGYIGDVQAAKSSRDGQECILIPLDF